MQPAPPPPSHLDGLQPSCLRLTFRLENARRRPHAIQLSVPSHHISVQTEHTSFPTFATALTVPSCPPPTPITLRLLHNHRILATIPVTYSTLLRSLTHTLATPHGLVHVFAAPHAPELATLRATLRVSSRGILNAARARFSVIGDCVVSLSHRCAGAWVPFYRSAAPRERAAGGELLSYGAERGADTHLRIDAFRVAASRCALVASVDVTLRHLLHPGRQLPLLNNFASKGFVKTADAHVDKHTARLALHVFLYARPLDAAMPVVEAAPAPPLTSPRLSLTPSDLKHASNRYDFRAPGLRNFLRGLLGIRRRRKLEHAALMVVRSVENHADTRPADQTAQLPFTS